MNLGEYYSYINYVTNKEQMGDPATPEIYNLLLNIAEQETFNDLLKEFIRLISDEQKRVADILTDTHPLKHFEKNKAIYYTNIDSPKLLKPADYAHYITIAGQINGVFKNIDVLDAIKFNERRRNLLSQPIYENPIANEMPEFFNVVPNNINKFEITYLRNPVSAHFDYCIDANDNIIYMPPGYQLQQINGVTNLYDSENNIVNTNVFPAKTVSFPYQSTSKELDWDELSKKTIINNVINNVLSRSRENAQQKAS